MNEAINGGDAALKDSAYNKVDDFICKAFKWANSADPDALLFYNDFNHAAAYGWQQAKSDRVYELVKTLKEAGCPIHGVGFQMHIAYPWFGTNMLNGMRNNIQRYKDLGMYVHITELDIKCKPNSAGDGCETAWDDAGRATQAQLYQDLLAMCLEEPNCNSFTTWGFTDKYSWLFNGAEGLPFDSNYNKKDAYTKMLDKLNSYSSSATGNFVPWAAPTYSIGGIELSAAAVSVGVMSLATATVSFVM